jgi:cathepsin D
MRLILWSSLCCFASGSFLQHVAAHNTGSQRNARSVNKNQGDVHESALSTPPLFKVPLHSPNGMQFVGDFTIGGQVTTALYDTGSFDIITASDLCSKCRTPPNLNLYSNKSSSTFKEGKTGVRGHMFTSGLLWARQDFETVHIGSADSVLSVDNTPFWQIVHTDMRLWTGNESTFSTYVGLGHGALVPGIPTEEPQMKTLVELSGTRRFAICLGANNGELVFNPTHDLTATAGMFRTVSVIGEHHWAVDMKSISYSIGGQGDSQCDGFHKCAAIIDSGTSLIGMPPRYYAFMEKITKMLKDDCSNLDKLPDLVFELGGQTFALPGYAYVIRATFADSYCYPAFMDIGMDSDTKDVWILGVPFLRHFYTVFDRDGPSLHIAEKGDECEPVGPAPPVASGSFLRPPGLAKLRRGLQPAIADISQASGPSWTLDAKHFIL